MNPYDITYEDKIGAMLLSLPIEQEYIFAGNVNPKNIDKFISVVKSYMDRNFGANETPAWEILIASDYLKIKKVLREEIELRGRESNLRG